MDYAGLINLALVTIIYSTFLSPNLEKLGSLREDIANIEFPLFEDDEETIAKIDLQGVSLDKKMTQYNAKYYEIIKYLRSFYAILFILLVIQAIVLFYNNTYSFPGIMSLLATVFVLILLVLTLRIHLTEPWKTRSIPWLAQAGIAPVYSNHLFEPKLSINKITKNVKNDDGYTRIAMLSNMDFRGFRYILTIESDDGERLYWLSAGTVSKYVTGGSIVNVNGLQQPYVNVARTKLKLSPHKYRARFLIFNAPFLGTYSVFETQTQFEVNEGQVRIPDTKINLSKELQGYSFKNVGDKIDNLTFTEGREKDKSIVTVLSSKNFVKLFSRKSRPFFLENKDGNLDLTTIEKYCSRKNIILRISRRYIKWPPIIKRVTYLKLSGR